MAQVERQKRQFQIRHMLGMTAGAAALFAILAPQLRRLDPDDQFSVLLQAVILVIVVGAIMAGLLYNRHGVEQKAGPLIARLEPTRSRRTFWLITAGLVLLYIFSIWMRLGTSARSGVPAIVFGNPVILFLAVNFAVVRGWWKIDPVGIEICEHGLILGGFRFHHWDDIQRFSWTGNPIRQLNLFCRSRHVVNFGVESGFVERLELELNARISHV